MLFYNYFWLLHIILEYMMMMMMVYVSASLLLFQVIFLFLKLYFPPHLCEV